MGFQWRHGNSKKELKESARNEKYCNRDEECLQWTNLWT